MGNSQSSSIPFKKEDVISYQQKNHICKIYMYLENILNGISNGFFCLIPYPDKDHLIHVLITTYRTLSENSFKDNNEIKLSLNNDKSNKTIVIDKNRKIYMSKEYDTTIIEINPEKDKINNFLELDENLLKDNSSEIYNQNKIYLICYGKDNKMDLYYGDIKEIEGANIHHISDTESGSGGCPILSVNSLKVIGIHLGRTPHEYKKGTLLNYPLKEFMEGNHFINLENINNN